MRRIALILALALATAFAGVAAPALSLRPYRPAAVDFEMAAPLPARASGAGGARVVSPVVRAPKRFNLVGLRWHGRAEPALALRARRAGGRWSEWVPLGAHAEHGPDAGTGERSAGGASDPLWVGEADELQFRADRMPPGLRLHFVNVRGTATAGDRLRTALRRSVNAALVRLAGPASATAQGAPPAIVPRADWERGQCAPRSGPRYGSAKAMFVHHTVSANEYAAEEVADMVLSICRYHRNSNGWDDIGYNFLVDRYGRLWEGRAGGIDRAVVGAHAQGFNSETTSVSNIGTHTDLPQTGAALDAMAQLIRWKLPVHGQPTSGTVELTSGGGSASRYPAGERVVFERVSGHRDAGRTSCPGEALYAQLPDLRARVGGAAPPRPARTRLRFRVAPRTLLYSKGAQLEGHLRLVAGDPIPDAPVAVQLFVRRAWRTIETLHTRADGSFAGVVSPPRNGLVRVSYAGGPATRPTVSSGTRVRVRPAVTVARSVRRADVGRTPIIEGTVTPAKRRVVVVVQRRVGRRNVTVKRYTVRVRRGRFRKGHRLREPGLHRFYAVFPGDGSNLASSSATVYVRAVSPAGGAGPARR